MSLPARDAELVQIVDAALANAARRAGDWLVCRAGCTPCCHGAFAISALDTMRIQAGMEELRKSAPELATRVELRSRAWVDERGPEFPGDVATGRLGESGSERERFEDFANEAACPALDPVSGLCEIYAWRPMTCRVFGPPVRMEPAADEDGSEAAALGHCELCFHGAGEDEVKACEMIVPRDLEAELLGETGDTSETVVAFALLG